MLQGARLSPLLPLLLLLLVCIPGYGLPARAAGQPGGSAPADPVKAFQYQAALERSQAAIGTRLGNHALTDHQGRALSLDDLRGKPLVLSLIYTSCYQICPMTTRHLAKVVDKARAALGDDGFNVAVLGFDAYNDSPQAMLHFARKQGIDQRGWYLLSASPDTIRTLGAEIGFEFFASPNGFDHITQATVIDADGRVYRQVYGEVFDTPLLVEPLKQLLLGQPRPEQTLISELIDKVRFFCTTYDPARDAYHFDYSLFIGIAVGMFVILSGVAFIAREILHARRSANT
ncbi:MAG: SCO family protein [Thiogranum sp.]|nr:SCO family protein [Thiogranum sp.]